MKCRGDTSLDLRDSREDTGGQINLTLRRCNEHLLVVNKCIRAMRAAAARYDVTQQSGLQDILQDVNSFPAKEIRDEFVNAFFEKINPYFPVVDESGFRARYADQDNQPPLLLLHTVLLVGAHVSSHPKAIKARHTVKAVLFRRAKCVFDMRHETDRLNLVQAALLFTWHLQNGDTASSNS